MDILNDYYPLYPENPETAQLSESEQSENNEYIQKLDNINGQRKRKKNLTFDDFCLKNSDDIWYLWCIINEFTENNSTPLLDKMDYCSFCTMCYNNSTRY